MERLRMARFFSQKENQITIPKFSTINVDFVKDYLYVDFDEDDMLIQLLIQTAKEIVSEEITIEEDSYEPTPSFFTAVEDTNEHPLDGSDLASTLVLMIVSDLYNTRSTTATDVKIKFSPLFTEMKKTLRGKMGGYRL